MKFILDAHIPPSLIEIFKDHEVIHTKDMPRGNLTADSEINNMAFENDAILITKDTDFYYSYLASKKPPKLILVKFGNKRLRELKEYFKLNYNSIIKLLQNHSFLILEEDRIRMIE